MKKLLSNKKGMTLIELLAVIAIIAILFVLLIPQIDNAIQKSRQSGLQTDFHSYQVATEAYFNEIGGEATDITKVNAVLDTSLQATAGKSKEKDPWGEEYDVTVEHDATKGSMLLVKSTGGKTTYTSATYFKDGEVFSCTTGFSKNLGEDVTNCGTL